MRRFSSHHSDISRRNLLRGAAGVTGGLIIGGSSPGCRKKSAPLEKKTADVVVVGAGLSGLITTRELLKAGVKSVLVLEARDRVGGLVYGQEAAPGMMVDGGGTWVGPKHTQMLELAKELGVESKEAYLEGNPIFLFGGVRVAGFSRLFSQEELKELRGLRDKVQTMAKEFPQGEPWKAPRAAEYDKMSMFNWLADNATTVWGNRDLKLGVDWKFGARIEDVSLLRFVAAVQAYGGLDPLMSLSESQRFTFIGGAHQIPQKLAEKLENTILLSSPVTRVVDNASEPLRVETDRLSIECSRVVFTMMPADLRRIEFEPKLPEQKQGLIGAWKGSHTYKAHVVYEKPFWRENRLLGVAIGDGKAVNYAFDVSPKSGTPGILVAIGSGEDLPSDVRARKETVVETLVKYFDEGARDPIHFVDTDWYSDKWSSGCASPLGPNVLTKYGPALRPPVGRIHWAGTDTAYEFDGSMEGAVRSGERVATEVAAVMREAGVIPAPAKSG